MNNIFVGSAEILRQKEIALSLRERTRGKTACVITFGCQQNEADSEIIAGTLETCGYTVIEDDSAADVVVINTCAIREHAEVRALSEAGQFKGIKERDRSRLIGVCGCMAQLPHRREQIKKSYPYVDFVFGTDMHHRIPEIIKTALDSKKRVTFANDLPHSEFGVISEGLPVRRSGSLKAWVPVMYGCNNFCSYCVVPYVRGRERSRDRKSVEEEVYSLLQAGYKDITLLGQNVNSYSGGCDFATLLRSVCSFGGEYRIRFMTSHPKDASDELIKAIAECGNAAKHFHLPVQSGNDRILGLMNRKYTRAQYLEKAHKIKSIIPDVAITSDIICSFPTETAAEFDDTVTLVEEVGFDMLYTFIYSPRVGTRAAEMEGRIPKEESNRRFALLSDRENAIAQSINEKSVGKTVRVLSEGIGKNGLPAGRTSGNKIVVFDKPVPEGQFVDIVIEKAQAYSLTGKLKD